VDLEPEGVDSVPERVDSGPEGVDSVPERVDSGPEGVNSQEDKYDVVYNISYYLVHICSVSIYECFSKPIIFWGCCEFLYVLTAYYCWSVATYMVFHVLSLVIET
jgi:hypothetical protein